MDIIERMAQAASKSTNPLKAIKAYCYQCLDGLSPDRCCTTAACPLHDFRSGTNPRRKQVAISEGRRQRMQRHAAEIRAKVPG